MALDISDTSFLWSCNWEVLDDLRITIITCVFRHINYFLIVHDVFEGTIIIIIKVLFLHETMERHRG